MDKLNGFIEVLIPLTTCNLKCHYCYVIQLDYRHNQKATFPKSPKEIAFALRPERFGGKMLISFCGAGETMMCADLPEIALELLKLGHYINITTNGTLDKAFNSLFDILEPYPQLRPHLNFSFSLHYLELKRLNIEDKFWSNVNKAKEKGCSFMVQFNLVDEYIPYLEDIKKSCMKHVGDLPQVAATRKEDGSPNIKLHTSLSKEEYLNLGESFKSPLFDFTMKNFMVKRKEYCFAGKWSYTLNLSTGIIKPCYCSIIQKNIYDNDSTITFSSIGHHCRSQYCYNSSHFISLGVIPEIEAPSYGELRNRKTEEGKEWYSPEFKSFVFQKLTDNHTPTHKISSEFQFVHEFTIKVCRCLKYRLIEKLIFDK